MCALSYYLERAGIMTTGISLVRENTESMQPPRSLWVSFPLGRPLGVPNDVEFQQRVIAAALELLKRDHGPILEDYPEDAPVVNVAPTPACPVSFTKATDQTTWQGRLSSELSILQPWYDLGRRRRGGRSLVGASDLSIDENLHKLGEYLDLEQLPTNELHWFKFRPTAIEVSRTIARSLMSSLQEDPLECRNLGEPQPVADAVLASPREWPPRPLRHPQ